MSDTQGKRLEYARLRTAIRKGRGSVSAPEMTALLIAEGGEPMAGNSYWRWESGDRSLTPERAELIARVAGVDAAWLLMLSRTAAPEPEGYREWLAAQGGAETTTPPREEAADDTNQIKTPIKRITVQGQRVDTGRGGRGKRTG